MKICFERMMFSPHQRFIVNISPRLLCFAVVGLMAIGVSNTHAFTAVVTSNSIARRIPAPTRTASMLASTFPQTKQPCVRKGVLASFREAMAKISQHQIRSTITDSRRDESSIEGNTGGARPRFSWMRHFLRFVPPSQSGLAKCLAFFLVASICLGLAPQSALASTTTSALTPAASAALATSSLGTAMSQSGSLSLAWEIRLCLRLLGAGIMGGAIGKERTHKLKQADKTLAMVSLGAAMFTICSVVGFAGTRYDSSRMASTVASGVGFIGAGVIYHEKAASSSSSDRDGPLDAEPNDLVHGLTTSAAIFLSAAIGVGCGVGLYIISGMSTLATLAILRLGGNVKQQNHVKHLYRQKQRARIETLQDKLVNVRDFEELLEMEQWWKEQLEEQRQIFGGPGTTSSEQERSAPKHAKKTQICVEVGKSNHHSHQLHQNQTCAESIDSSADTGRFVESREEMYEEQAIRSRRSKGD